MDEYAERMGLAYPAVTYGDLDPLCADLPAVGPMIARPRAAPHAAAPPAAVGCPRRRADGTQGAVDDLADRRGDRRGGRGLGQWHRWPPGRPVAALGGRSIGPR